MILEIDWQVFHTKYYNTGAVYVSETDQSWIFLSCDRKFIIRCEVAKSGDVAEDMAFLDRYTNERANVVWCRVPEEEEDELEFTDEDYVEELESGSRE